METWVDPKLWHDFYEKSTNWAISTIPGLLLLAILGFIALNVITVFLSRLKIVLLKKHNVDDVSDMESIKRVETLMSILQKGCVVTVWILLMMLMLKKVGVDIAPLIAGAGIIGLAVGFGAQELVRDFISGFFMLMENQVRAGDVVIVNGQGGLVESIGLRTIQLRDMSGTVHVFQNGKINTLANMTLSWSAMVFDIGVSYKENTDQVTELIKQVGAEMQQQEKYKDSILAPLEIFGVDDFADSAVVIKARFKTRPIKQWEVGREFRRQLKMKFDANGIEMPFPHMSLYWGEASKPFKLAQNTTEA